MTLAITLNSIEDREWLTLRRFQKLVPGDMLISYEYDPDMPPRTARLDLDTAREGICVAVAEQDDLDTGTYMELTPDTGDLVAVIPTHNDFLSMWMRPAPTRTPGQPRTIREVQEDEAWNEAVRALVADQQNYSAYGTTERQSDLIDMIRAAQAEDLPVAIDCATSAGELLSALLGEHIDTTGLDIGRVHGLSVALWLLGQHEVAIQLQAGMRIEDGDLTDPVERLTAASSTEGLPELLGQLATK